MYVLVSLQLSQNSLSPEWRNRFPSAKTVFVTFCKEHEQDWVFLTITLRPFLSELGTSFVIDVVNENYYY